jgi:hypothetical protein
LSSSGHASENTAEEKRSEPTGATHPFHVRENCFFSPCQCV